MISEETKHRIFRLPEEPNDYFRFILAVIVIITACYMVASQQDIPTWLIGIIGSIISFYLGLISSSKRIT